MTWTPVVTFNYDTWILRYPEFSNVSEALGQLFFNEAQLYCANSLSNPASLEVWQLTLFLYQLTSHVAALNSATLNGQPNSDGTASATGIVGRISNATEGSVSVAAELPNLPAAAAFYATTRYGLAFWAATACFRTMSYVPGPIARPAFPGPGYGGFGGPWGGGYGNGGGWGNGGIY